jgi:sensor histidine kinase YesM
VVLLKRILTLNISVGVVAFLLTVGLYHSDRAHLLDPFLLCVAMSFFVGTPITIVLSRFGRRLYHQRFPLNWVLISGCILGSAVLGTLLVNVCMLPLRLLEPSEFWGSFWERAQFSAILAMVVGIGAVGHRVLRSDLETTTLELRNRQLEEERAKGLAVEAQLASLESHVRPHFLFNTLNTISSLIPEDPKLAESLVGKLAALLRFSLDSDHDRVSSLERELKIVSDYLEIERARFGERLRYDIRVPQEHQAAEVPALSLQTLVENAVKHAVAPRLGGAEIRLTAHASGDCLILEVSDDGPGFTAASIRPGHGLDNLQRRAAALFGPTAGLEVSRTSNRTSVALRLPLTGRRST